MQTRCEHDRAPDQQSRCVQLPLRGAKFQCMPHPGTAKGDALTWQMGVPQETSLRCLQL